LAPKKVVAVGSKNRSKIAGVKRAWRLFEDAEVVGVEVPRSARQPVGWGEVARGALDRALKALEAVEGASYGVGVEAGLVPAPFPSGFAELQIAVVVDSGGGVSVGASPAFEAPYAFLEEILLYGRELGELAKEALRRAAIKERLGVVGYLSLGALTRADLAFHATLCALLPRMSPGAYGKVYKVEEYEKILASYAF